eukprot:gene32557-45204_t
MGQSVDPIVWCDNGEEIIVIEECGTPVSTSRGWRLATRDEFAAVCGDADMAARRRWARVRAPHFREGDRVAVRDGPADPAGEVVGVEAGGAPVVRLSGRPAAAPRAWPHIRAQPAEAGDVVVARRSGREPWRLGTVASVDDDAAVLELRAHDSDMGHPAPPEQYRFVDVKRAGAVLGPGHPVLVRGEG